MEANIHKIALYSLPNTRVAHVAECICQLWKVVNKTTDDDIKFVDLDQPMVEMLCRYTGKGDHYGEQLASLMDWREAHMPNYELNTVAKVLDSSTWVHNDKAPKKKLFMFINLCHEKTADLLELNGFVKYSVTDSDHEQEIDMGYPGVTQQQKDLLMGADLDYEPSSSYVKFEEHFVLSYAETSAQKIALEIVTKLIT